MGQTIDRFNVAKKEKKTEKGLILSVVMESVMGLFLDVRNILKRRRQ